MYAHVHLCVCMCEHVRECLHVCERVHKHLHMWAQRDCWGHTALITEPTASTVEGQVRRQRPARPQGGAQNREKGGSPPRRAEGPSRTTCRPGTAGLLPETASRMSSAPRQPWASGINRLGTPEVPAPHSQGRAALPGVIHPDPKTAAGICSADVSNYSLCDPSRGKRGAFSLLGTVNQ